MTGVPVMPISGVMSQHSPVSLFGTVVTPAAGLMKLTFQIGDVLPPSASNAYTLSCSVATYTTFRMPTLGTLTLDAYSGEACAIPSVVYEKRFPNVVALTLLCVRTVSFRFWPVRALSL